MSKKIFAALIVAVVATLAGYNIYQSQRAEVTMSDLAMANVEALANDGEGGKYYHRMRIRSNTSLLYNTCPESRNWNLL